MCLFFVLVILVIAVLAIARWSYRFAFYAPPRPPYDPEKIDYPEGEIYKPFHGKMEKWIMETRALPQEDITITSFDGLKLWGTYYTYAPGATIEIMFHGYRGSAQREMAAGVQRAAKLGHSTLLIDQRCCGRSEGKTITFGVNEYKDCLYWVDYLVKRFGPEVKIILTGMSMGAATVMMAADKGLPENVVGILADCGYNSQKDIIHLVTRGMHLPPRLSYPFVKLGARLFGHFDLDETTPEESLKNCKIPVLFIHGEDDDFVPCYMSKICYDACASRKKLVTVPKAGHGLAYPVNPQLYVESMREFFYPQRER